MKKNNGITLIALIVTVIVLLILAGITLSLVTGNNGVIGKATKAVYSNNEAQIKEEVELAISEGRMQYYSEVRAESFLEYLASEEFSPYTTATGGIIEFSTDGKITYRDVKNNEYYFEMDEDGRIELVGKSNGVVEDKQPPIVKIDKTTTSSIKFTITDKSGVVAYAITEDRTEPSSWTEIELSKNYVGEITGKTSNKSYYIWAKDSAGNISSGTEAKTIDFEAFAYEITDWNGTKAIITVKSSNVGVQYKIGTSSSWIDYSETSKPEVESGATIYFQVTDGTNTKSYGSVVPLWTGTVSYDANGGTGEPSSQQVQHTKTVTVNFSTIPTKEKCNFLGWSTSSSATTATYTQTGTKIFTMGTSNVTLYAVWEKIEVSANNYGDPVNYSVTVNGVTLNNWKIFYNDGDTITMIYGDYLPNSTNLATNAGLTQGTNFDYKAYAVFSTVSRDDLINKLNDSSKWSSLINDNLKGKAVAKGATDMKTWVASWNSKGYTRLYTNLISTGYQIGTNPTSLNVSQTVKSDTAGYGDTLYFPYQKQFDHHCNGYWLASPSSNGTREVITVLWRGLIRGHPYNYSNSGGSPACCIRPIICLSSDVNLQKENGVWQIKE